MDEKLIDDFNFHFSTLQEISRNIRRINPKLLNDTPLFSGAGKIEITKPVFTTKNNAELYSNRRELIAALASSKIINTNVIAEIGVLHGDFSKFLLETLNPTIFHLFDRDFRKLKHTLIGNLKFHEGNSSEMISSLPEESIDLAYVDGDHSLTGIMKDVQSLLPKMRGASIIIFNDYSLFNVSCLTPCGVIDAVHHVLNTTDYKIHSMCLKANSLNDMCLIRN